MSDDKMCPILTIGEAVILSSLERWRTTDTLTLDHCWRMCEGESCGMYERCVPQMLTVESTVVDLDKEVKAMLERERNQAGHLGLSLAAEEGAP